MSVNRKAVVIYGSTDLWIYWDKADKLRLFYRDISHNLCAKRVATIDNTGVEEAVSHWSGKLFKHGHIHMWKARLPTGFREHDVQVLLCIAQSACQC